MIRKICEFIIAIGCDVKNDNRLNEITIVELVTAAQFADLTVVGGGCIISIPAVVCRRFLR
jgi:hypothetical protein